MKTMQYFKNVVTLKLNTDLCTGCKMCAIVCPHSVFEIRDKKARIVDIDDCMECGACALNCQYGAITVKSGVGCAAGILNGILNNTESSCDCSKESNIKENTCC
jgi:NAD-dependent dihydropyrimidine dehydrogenase PreA subunit